MFRKIKLYIEDYLDWVARSSKTGKEAAFLLFPFIIPLLVILFIMIFLFSDWDNRMLYLKDKLEPNYIEVQTSGLEQSDIVKIGWKGEFYADTLTLFQKGEETKSKFKQAGNNYFFVFVNNQLLDTKVQYKKKYWKGYHYTFLIYRRESSDSLIVDLKIED